MSTATATPLQPPAQHQPPRSIAPLPPHHLPYSYPSHSLPLRPPSHSKNQQISTQKDQSPHSSLYLVASFDGGFIPKPFPPDQLSPLQTLACIPLDPLLLIPVFLLLPQLDLLIWMLCTLCTLLRPCTRNCSSSLTLAGAGLYREQSKGFLFHRIPRYGCLLLLSFGDCRVV
ncbi:hypothetical protein SLE2022_173480 [Rubroshorea leprosula]